MNAIAPIRSKLAKVVAMLSSSNDGDRRNAWRALNKILRDNNCTFVDLAELIEQPPPAGESFLKAEVLQSYDRGFADGKSSAQPGAPAFDVPDWRKIAAAIEQHVGDLIGKDREFAEDMIIRIRFGRQPTPKQAIWFQDIFVKLGRRHGFTI